MIKFFIDQHGCAKNQVDGELLISQLCAMGYEQTFKPEEASLIVINSCGFIESAKKESLDAVYSARQQYPGAKILLAGCLAQRYAEVLRTELPEADGIFGNGDLSRLPQVVTPLMQGTRTVQVPPQKGVCCGDRSMLLSFRGAAYVKITEGCNNHCTFCAIPLIRGELRSRPAAEILTEIQNLVARGVYEINLIGQDLAAYGTGREDSVFGAGQEPLASLSADGTFSDGGRKSALARLLRMISALPGSFRLRMLYIHPDHFNRDVLPVIKADSRLLPYFDIPFQSGDDTLIHAMNRTGSSAAYAALVADIRKAFPDAAIRTTFLTGFPGETEQAAQHTQDFLQTIQSDWSGCFPYSREEDTPAWSLKPRVPKKTAAQRAAAIGTIQADITRRRLAGRTGRDYDVLIEEVIAGEDGLAIGRAWFQAPEVDGSVVVRYEKTDEAACRAVQPGRVVRARAVAAGDVDLDAEFISDSPVNALMQSSDLQYAPEQGEEDA